MCSGTFPERDTNEFLDHVAEHFVSGKRLVDELPQERIADNDELAPIVQAAEAELASRYDSGPPAPCKSGSPTTTNWRRSRERRKGSSERRAARSRVAAAVPSPARPELRLERTAPGADGLPRDDAQCRPARMR